MPIEESEPAPNKKRMNSGKILIRHATPADAAFLAKAILTAGRAHVKRGIWEAVLGTTEEECEVFLRHIASTEIPHLFHYTCYLIAESGRNNPVGSLGGYNPEISGYHALRQAMPEVIRKLNLPQQAFKNTLEHSSKILACLPNEVAGAWVVDSVAVLQEHRRRGVAGSLMERILLEGKRQGHLQAQVSMYIGNDPALSLYRRLGFEIIEEKRDKYFEEIIGSPGMLSLVRDLK